MQLSRSSGPRALAAGIVLVAAFTSITVSVSADTSNAPVVDARISVVADGTPDFDAGAPLPTEPGGAGLDAGATNGVVRTGDTVAYRVDWSVNSGAASSVVAVVRAGPGMFWSDLPPACRQDVAPTSSITPSVLTCNVGENLLGGTTGTFDVIAHVAVVRNGSPLDAAVDVGAAGADTVTATAPTILASASSKANVVQQHSRVAQVFDVTNPRTGALGRIFLFPVTVEVPGGGKGAEALDPAQVLRFTEDISDLPPSAELADASWPLPTPNQSSSMCGPHDQITYGVPFGRVGTPNPLLSTTTTATVDSGTWTCTADPSSRSVDVSVSGADLAAATSPVRDGMGQLLEPGRTVIIAGQVGVFVSEDDLAAISGPEGSGSLAPVRIGWDVPPVGTSGEAAAGEDPSDDTIAAAFELTRLPNFESFYAGDLGTSLGDGGWGVIEYLQPTTSFVGSSWSTFVPTQSPAANVGDGRVVPGQPLGIALTPSNESDEPQHSSVCTQLSAGQTLRTIDSFVRHDFTGVGDLVAFMAGRAPETSVETTGPFVGSPVAVGSVVRRMGLPYNAYLSPGGLGRDDVQIEYSTQRHDHDGDCGSSKGWTTIEPDDLATVTQVRVTTLRPLVPQEVEMVYIGMTATPEPSGTKIWQSSSTLRWPAGAAFPEDTTWSKRTSGYDPDQFCSLPDSGPDPVFNDCLTIEAAQLDVRKSVTSDRTAGLRAGDTVDFRIDGAVLGQPGASVEDATVSDVLPEGLTLVGPTQPPSTLLGRTIVWHLGAVPYGSDFSLTYRATVDPGVAEFATLTNTVTFDADVPTGPGSWTPLPPATAVAQVQAAGSVAELKIQKSTTTPLIDRGGVMQFVLHYRNSGTTADIDPTFIDVFPHNGDGRSPATEFDGTARLRLITGSGGEAITVTSAPPPTIAPDPADPSNQPGGSTIWCDVTDVDPATPDVGDVGCPATLGDATAARITRPGALAPGAAFEVTIDLATAGNTAANLYTNQFSGRVANIALPVLSNPVTVRVRGMANATANAVTTTSTAGVPSAAAATTPTTRPDADDAAHDDARSRDDRPDPSSASEPGALAFTGGNLAGVVTGLALVVIGVAVLRSRRRTRGDTRGEGRPGHGRLAG